MEPDTPLDCVLLQLSPKRSRCELFVSTDGKTEKLASGLLKSFVTHLKVAEQQAASAVQSIKLDAGGLKDAHLWFRKGTLDRFIQFVSTPQVLELVNNFDAEMSQLESARRIYSQGMVDELSGLGDGGSGGSAAAGATKRELLRAIDLRLTAVQQDFMTACSRAATAGFNLDTVSELKMFADQFGADQLNEACSKFIASCERWREISIRSSYGSDMSIDDELIKPNSPTTGFHPTGRDLDSTQQHSRHLDLSNTSCQQPRSSSGVLPLRHSSNSSIEPEEKSKDNNAQPESISASQPMRRLSVQDRINMFESKQKENVGKPDVRRLSSDVSAAPPVVEKAVLRRWSGVSDMSIDLSGEKEGESPLCTPSSATVSQSKSEDQQQSSVTDRTSSSSKPEFRSDPLRVRGDSGWPESGSGTRDKETLAPHNKETGCDSSCSTQHLGKSSGEIEETKKNEAATSFGKVDDGSASTFGDTEYPTMNFKKQAVGTEVIKRPQDLMKNAKSVCESEETVFSVKSVKDAQEGFGSIPEPPIELAQRLRHSKGNQELNDELKIKANELEKLFAEHKQRVPGDQFNHSRRNRAVEMQNPAQASSLHRNRVTDNVSIPFPDKYMLDEPARISSDMVKSEIAPVVRIADNHVHIDAINENLSDLSFSETSRGKLYQRYTQIRDAKLRQEWNSKGPEKEARLKAMQNSFEKSRTEMKAKFSGSADKDDSVFSTQRRTERRRSFNSRPLMRREKQQHLDFEQSENEGITKFPDGKPHVEGSYFNVTQDASFEDVFRSAQVKKLFPSKSLSASTPRVSTATVPRSDTRKENAKPSSTAGKAARLQSRSISHSKNTREEVNKSRRSQPLRKNSANSGEFRETSVLNYEDVLTPLKDHEETVNKYRKKLDSKPLHKKSQSTDFSSTVDISKQKDSIAAETVNSDEEYEDAIFEPEDSMNAVGHEDDEEFEINIENGGSRPSPESEESTDFGSENGDLVRSFVHINPCMGAELPATAPSDVDDAFVDCSVSWNSHQPEVDAARMRKKWGNAQKPTLAVNSSQNQPCKDVTRGFKRLLKFGRKNRGMESLVDRFSVTTSEGDDDTEDGRDVLVAGQSGIPAPPANFKLTEDHLSGSSLKAPRSFFSLSTFRSKGSDSKIR